MALGSPPRQHAAGGLNRLLRGGTAANQQQQQQQASNTGDTAPSSTAAAKKIMLQKYLTDCRSLYSCLYCRTHLANHDELISRSFQGNRSRAYLFNAVINITAGPAVQRELNTGSHAVADIFCTNCGTTIGWKYERAYVDSQKYKEGKFIIELAHVVRENRHLELDTRDRFLSNLQHENSISLRASQLHSGDPTQAPTVGQLERGSLSPPSSSPSGSGWSSSPGSTSGGFCWARVAHEQRRDNESDEEKEEEEKEEEEVLMFPFHDDLFGERASYSNLCGSRLSCRRRDRRSLHLDSAPYDWKLAARPLSLVTAAAAAAAPTQQASPTSPPVDILDAGGPNENERPNSTLPRSISTSSTMGEGKHEDCSASSSSSEVSSSVSSAGGDSEIQFELEPCASPPTAPAPISKDCDRTGGTGEPGPEADAPGRVRDDEDEQERRQRQASGSASGRMGAGGGGGLSRNHSLSLDEEEFYDCCTDHQVSNLSTVFAN